MTEPLTRPTSTALLATVDGLDAIVRCPSHLAPATWTEAASLAWELGTALPDRPRVADAPAVATAEQIRATGSTVLHRLHELIGSATTAVDAVRYGEASARLRDALLYDFGDLG